MGGVQGEAQQGPGAQDGAAARALLGGPVEAEVVHDRVVEAVEDVEPGAEVVEGLGGGKVARVEHTAGGPARDADVRERDVKGPQRVGGGNRGAHLAQAVGVRPQVGGREEDREGLLDAEEAPEGPLAVELHDGLRGGRARRRDDVLARVVALGRAVPEEEAEVEGCCDEVTRGVVI